MGKGSWMMGGMYKVPTILTAGRLVKFRET